MPENCKKGERACLVILMLLVFLASSTTLCTRTVAASTGSGKVLDLFTQKAPFDGRGPNQPSDAFQPQELVILYGNVTYNGAPVANKLVAFQVRGPANAFSNITFTGSSSSNESGMATFSFRVPWYSEHAEEIVFDEWFAVATVDIAQEVATDTLTFQVGWILRITNITTLNSELVPQNTFFRQDIVNFAVTVESIAMVEKTGAITIDVKDAAGYPIIHIEMENLSFQPGENYVNASSHIPDTAALGNANVTAAIYDKLPENGGVLYSPAISTTFEIVEKRVITIDVAVVAVISSKTVVQSGETVQIMVVVRNNGEEAESFNVTLYYDDTVIDKKLVTELPPSAEQQMFLEWNTTGVPLGSYVIKAVADAVKGETNVDNNIFVDGTVTILKTVPQQFPFLNIVFLIFIFIIGIIAGSILLLILGFLTIRRKKRVPRRYAIIVHPHI
ncbi:MAG: CARDB domain-containing protein [Candidatus Bathyarchaeia archaeon]|jgi:hypothetical protein